MIKVEHSDTFDYPAASVFAALIDIEARPVWQPSLVEERITPPGPARSGATVFEVHKFSGYTSEKTMTVSEFEQDRLLTLETLADAQAPFRESYRIEPIS